MTNTSTTTATGSTSTVDYAETLAALAVMSATVAGTIGNGGVDPEGYGNVANAGGTSMSMSTDAGNAQATITGSSQRDRYFRF